MPEKISITVEDMMDSIGVCEELAREFDPIVPSSDLISVRPQTLAEAKKARALRLAAAMMRTSVVGTIVVPDPEVRS